MNIRRLTVVAAAIAVAVAVAVATPALAVAPAKPSGTLTIYTHQTQRDVLDLGESGSSTGDIVTGSGSVAMSKSGKAVGTYAYSSETVRVNIPGGSEMRISTSVYTLPGGTILVSGLTSVQQGTRPTKPQAQVIVGGTGKYAGAAGSVAVVPRNANDYTRVFSFVS